MIKTSLVVALLSFSVFGQTLEEFKKEQLGGYQEYKKSQEEAFAAYKKAQMKAFEEYKKEISKVWKDPKLSTKKEWVEYSPDKKTRTDVDFAKEEIIVETIAKSEKEAQQKLKKALAKVVLIDTKRVQESDPLEKKLAKIKKPKGIVDKPVRAEPILAPVIFKSKPTMQNVKKFVNQHVTSKKVEVEKSKVPHANVYRVKVQLPSNTTIKRSKIYEVRVRREAKKQNIPVPLVFAIMHSESSFNPRARSHIPAYGLMQIVPKTAGMDSYNYLYHKKRLVSGRYLYDSTNNITLGSAYLHILYYSYLRKIKNPESRLYCTIAAYNTGAGNIAYAFNRYKSNLTRRQKYKMKYAADDINALTPKEVYAKLMKDLRWDEPKHYLKKVSKRMAIYHKIYGL